MNRAFNNIRKIKNTTIISYDNLIQTKKEIENEISNLQREKDLKVDRINNEYETKIDAIVRAINFVDSEISKSKEYLKIN